MNLDITDERLVREKQFHDARFGGSDEFRQATDKYYVLMQRPRQRFQEIVLEYAVDRDLLDYGCSTGESSILWARHGAKTTGIDLSVEAIRTAGNSAKSEGLDIRFAVMNAERMDFGRASFDVVTGTGILHHLRVDTAFREIARVLRDNGSAVFIEPLGHNPFINLYRKLTPTMRSEDEHPLTSADLDTAAGYFHDVELTFFNISTLLAVPFRSGPLFRPLHGLFCAIDSALFRLLPFTRRYAWMVLIRLSRPRRDD